mgnify:CR=1 FL=1|tara:strand:+ start:252 stop:452 length:201 start_codon:yes stop_codon:yes gene_type:complete
MGKGLGYRTDFHLRFKGLKDQITEPVTINGYSNCTCGKRNHIHLVIDPDRMFDDKKMTQVNIFEDE